ncbi:MAG: hypothetical protein KAU21_12200 [Gammaproteobacteria bacterium]|nr:hypothetical protein [Gammaproteobacteria bacterium]
MRSILIIILFSIIGACSSEKISVPQGPEGSWWLGGADGGVFVNITDDQNINDDLYIGTIYFDADQAIWYQGPFKLIGDLKFQVNDHSQFLAWDGENLYLKESSSLKAVNPIPQL